MNAKQKLHQIKLAHWTAQFQEQASSGLTVKAWCLDALLPTEHDIVPLTATLSTPSTTQCLPLSGQSLDSRELHNYNSISITSGDIQVTIGSSISVEKLLQILWTVRHA